MESIEEFYQRKFDKYVLGPGTSLGQFNVFSIEKRMRANEELPHHVRRNFFKIMLFSGDNIFRYSNQDVKVSGNTLLFFHPDIPYSYKPLSAKTKGHFCIFKGEFFQENHKLDLNNLSLFKSSKPPVVKLSKARYREVEDIFLKMHQEVKGDYIFKYELIKNYVSELYYLAMKWSPPKNVFQPRDAGKRITLIFLELLEQQFPTQDKINQFVIRTPGDYAEKLSIHVNYLNRAVKSATGKTTSQHIFERLCTEAKILLRHTDWSISEIAGALGFDDLAHFNKFFRKQTGSSPTSFRLV